MNMRKESQREMSPLRKRLIHNLLITAGFHPIRKPTTVVIAPQHQKIRVTMVVGDKEVVFYCDRAQMTHEDEWTDDDGSFGHFRPELFRGQKFTIDLIVNEDQFDSVKEQLGHD